MNMAASLLLAVALFAVATEVLASEPVNTAGPLDCTTGICTQRLVRETVPQGTKPFHWTTLTQLFNRTDFGENVATYSQAWKYGIAPTWSMVGETRCIEQRGGCHGAEVDLVVDGPLQFGDWRLGQSIIIWKLPGSTGVPMANHGLLISPEWARREEIRTDVGLKVDTRNITAAIQVRSGEKIALDDEGNVAFRFNPVNHTVELLYDTTVLWSVPVPSTPKVSK